MVTQCLRDAVPAAEGVYLVLWHPVYGSGVLRADTRADIYYSALKCNGNKSETVSTRAKHTDFLPTQMDLLRDIL